MLIDKILPRDKIKEALYSKVNVAIDALNKLIEKSNEPPNIIMGVSLPRVPDRKEGTLYMRMLESTLELNAGANAGVKLDELIIGNIGVYPLIRLKENSTITNNRNFGVLPDMPHEDGLKLDSKFVLKKV